MGRIRRTLMAALVLGWVASAGAQSAPRPLAAVGAFSLLGDGVEVTVNDSPNTDTRVARTRRETYAFPKIGFDVIATRELREAMVRVAPTASLNVYTSSVPLSGPDQRGIAQGAHEGGLPEWMIRIVQQRRLSHVLLVTRARSEIKLRTGDGDAIGRGHADGIGFYVDTSYRVRNSDTGAVATGALGPHVFVELTLMDTDSAKVVRSYTIRDQWLVASTESRAEVDPWSYLSAEEKIATLRNALESSLRRVLPAFLKGEPVPAQQ